MEANKIKKIKQGDPALRVFERKPGWRFTARLSYDLLVIFGEYLNEIISENIRINSKNYRNHARKIKNKIKNEDKNLRNVRFSKKLPTYCSRGIIQNL